MADIGTPLYDETAWAHGFAPMPRQLGTVRTGRLVRVAPAPVEAVAVRYTGHGLGHGTYRPDVTR